MKYPFTKESTLVRNAEEDDSAELPSRSVKGRILRSGIRKIEVLRWHECNPSDTFIEFGDALFVLNFLRRFANSSLSMMILRDVLAESLPHAASISRLTDHEILQQLAWQITRGYIRLVPREGEERHIMLAAPSEIVEEQVAEAPPPRAEPAPAAVPVEAAEPAEELQPVAAEFVMVAVAPAAQAATLKQAAVSGTPFCDT